MYSELIDSNGEIIEHNDDNGLDYNFKMTCELLGNTTYYIMVSGALNDTTTGIYELKINKIN